MAHQQMAVLKYVCHTSPHTAHCTHILSKYKTYNCTRTACTSVVLSVSTSARKSTSRRYQWLPLIANREIKDPVSLETTKLSTAHITLLRKGYEEHDTEDVIVVDGKTNAKGHERSHPQLPLPTLGIRQWDTLIQTYTYTTYRQVIGTDKGTTNGCGYIFPNKTRMRLLQRVLLYPGTWYY
jgi:hypothetical protein